MQLQYKKDAGDVEHSCGCYPGQLISCWRHSLKDFKIKYQNRPEAAAILREFFDNALAERRKWRHLCTIVVALRWLFFWNWQSLQVVIKHFIAYLSTLLYPRAVLLVMVTLVMTSLILFLGSLLPLRKHLIYQMLWGLVLALSLANCGKPISSSLCDGWNFMWRLKRAYSHIHQWRRED